MGGFANRDPVPLVRGVHRGAPASERPLKSTDGLLHRQHPRYLDLVYCGGNYGGVGRQGDVVTCLWCMADDGAPF